MALSTIPNLTISPVTIPADEPIEMSVGDKTIKVSFIKRVEGIDYYTWEPHSIVIADVQPPKAIAKRYYGGSLHPLGMGDKELMVKYGIEQGPFNLNLFS